MFRLRPFISFNMFVYDATLIWCRPVAAVSYVEMLWIVLHIGPVTDRRLCTLARYSFAIVGINITGLTYQLLVGGHLKTHFYNVVPGRPHLDHFHQVYCMCCLHLTFYIQLNKILSPQQHLALW